MFLRGTMGLSAKEDEYCRQGDEALSDLANTVKVVDYMLQFNNDFDSHVIAFRKILERCQQHNITLGIDNLKFAEEEVHWASYIIDTEGIVADPRKLVAISKFPAPTKITELRRFMEMMEKMASFSAEISSTATPL